MDLLVRPKLIEPHRSEVLPYMIPTVSCPVQPPNLPVLGAFKGTPKDGYCHWRVHIVAHNPAPLMLVVEKAGEKAAQSFCHRLSEVLLCCLQAHWVAFCLVLEGSHSHTDFLLSLNRLVKAQEGYVSQNMTLPQCQKQTLL